MEVAVSALFLLALLLPGFILQTAYTKGFWRWNSPTTTKSITEQIPGGIVSASVLHLIWATLSTWLGYRVDLNAVLMLLLGAYGHDDKYFEDSVHSFTNYPYRVFFYFSSLYIGAAFLGYFFHYLVRRFK